MEKTYKPPIIYHLIILGDPSVGKTCTLLRYLDNEYLDDTLTTIGIDIKKKEVTIIDDNGEEKKIKVKFVDTAGQERFRTITSTYYKHADGIMLMFDVTQRNTYENINYWVEEINKKCKSDIPIIVLGNKIDLNNRIKSREEFEEEMKKYNYDYYEVSAKLNINIKEAIEKMCLLMYKFKLSQNKKNKNLNQNSILLNEVNNNPERKCCDL